MSAVGAARLAAALAALLLGSDTALAYQPQVNYMLQCMGCHRPDGSGEPGRVPSVRRTLVRFARLAEGRRYLVSVPGAAQSRLTDAELAELINWMMDHLSDLPATGIAPFTAAEVTRNRRPPLIEVSATRARLIDQTR